MSEIISDVSLFDRMVAEGRPFTDYDISVLLGVDLSKDLFDKAPEGYEIPKSDEENIQFRPNENRIVYMKNGGPQIIQAVESQKTFSGVAYRYYRPIKEYFPSA